MSVSKTVIGYGGSSGVCCLCSVCEMVLDRSINGCADERLGIRLRQICMAHMVVKRAGISQIVKNYKTRTCVETWRLSTTSLLTR